MARRRLINGSAVSPTRLSDDQLQKKIRRLRWKQKRASDVESETQSKIELLQAQLSNVQTHAERLSIFTQLDIENARRKANVPARLVRDTVGNVYHKPIRPEWTDPAALPTSIRIGRDWFKDTPAQSQPSKPNGRDWFK